MYRPKKLYCLVFATYRLLCGTVFNNLPFRGYVIVKPVFLYLLCKTREGLTAARFIALQIYCTKGEDWMCFLCDKVVEGEKELRHFFWRSSETEISVILYCLECRSFKSPYLIISRFSPAVRNEIYIAIIRPKWIMVI